MVGANLKVYRSNGKIENPVRCLEIGERKSILPQNYGIPWFFTKNLYKMQFLRDNHIEFPDYKRGQDPVFLANVLKNIDFIYCLPIDFYAYKVPFYKTYKPLNEKKRIKLY